MLNREEVIEKIIQCVDAAFPFIHEEDGLDVARGYKFMLDENKEVSVNIVFENRV